MKSLLISNSCKLWIILFLLNHNKPNVVMSSCAVNFKHSVSVLPIFDILNAVMVNYI